MVTLVCLCMWCAAKLILKGIINHFCNFISLETEVPGALHAIFYPRNCWLVYHAVLALLLL